MALLTDSGESYTLSGNLGSRAGIGRQNREDLADFITNISPTDCPFTSGIGRTEATAVTHEWLTHSLAAAAADNVVVEGNEASLTTPTTLTRVTNVCQINQKSVAISGTQDRVRKAGMARELAYRVVLHTKEIKRDIETAALQNTQAVTGDTTTARQMNGVEGFISTNTASAITTDPVASDINAMLESCWDEGGNPDTLMCNGTLKRKISAIAGQTTSSYEWNMNASAKKFQTAVDVWDGDFGIQRIIPNRFDNTQTVKALEMGLWKLAQLRPLMIEELAKTGDTTKRMLTCETTLECRAENANGIRTFS